MFKSHWKVIEVHQGLFELYRRKWWQIRYRKISNHWSLTNAHNALFDHLKKEGKFK